MEPARSGQVALYRLAASTRHPPALSDVLPPMLKAVTAIRTVAVRELAIEELARGPEATAGNTPAAPGFEPLILVVSLRDQKLDVYRGKTLVTSSKVSSGKRGYDTKAGVFSILEKRRYHRSNLYSGAPMPWMQRLTWTGTALHAGVVPGYPASHGCIRLPFSFAPKLFQMTTVGANVVVTGDRVAPKPIEHANLFTPVSPPKEVAVAAIGPDPLVQGVVSTAAAAERLAPADGNAEAVADGVPDAPLRILVTRRTARDQVIGAQYALASLGYLAPQNFSGRLGAETLAAIKAFEKANGLPETGVFSADLAKRVYDAAGQPEPPEGHLFVRQDFRPMLDMPIAFHEPEQPLGTHVFTLGIAPGSGRPEWTAISLEGGDSANVLDRIEIPADARRTISERLRPGSSLIVADTSVNSAILPDGDDFLVLAKIAPTAASEPAPTAKQKRAKATNALAKPRIQETRKRTAKQIGRSPDLYGGFRLFRRW
jgi:peptidoglycan hydrolase-like protein with peptidoglycan-binding domain